MYLMQQLFLILGLVGFYFGAAAQNPVIGEWRSHLPYAKVTEISDGGDHIVAMADVYHFSFDKDAGIVQRYDKVWGLSDVSEAHVAYNLFNDALVVTYSNTNIDLIKNGVIINLSDIKRKSVGGNKSINNIVFYDSLAYLSTSFGIVILNTEREEFSDTYIIGNNGNQIGVYGVAIFNDSIFAATDEGVKVAPLTGSLLGNYQNWRLYSAGTGLPVGKVDQIAQFNNGVYALQNNTIYKYSAVSSTWSNIYAPTSKDILKIRSSSQYLVVCEMDTSGVGGVVTLFNSTDAISQRTDNKFAYIRDALIDDAGILWVADEAYGLLRKEGSISALSVQPNGPSSASVADLSIRDGQVWVVPGSAFSHFSYLDNGTWYNRNQYSDAILEGAFYMQAVLAVPNTKTSYFGSDWEGLFRYNNGAIEKYTDTNSTLEGKVGDAQRVSVGGFALDDQGYLWVSNYGSSVPLHALSPNGDWKSFTPQTPIASGAVTHVVLDEIGNKWVAISGANGQGFLVFNYGNDYESASDDLYKVLTASAGNGGLHNEDVLCVVKDNDGEIWFGTAEGIGVFYCPTSIFSDQGCDAQRILVERDGFAGYLLETERVQCIAVDGANRKWVGTANGLWLFSPDGTEEIAFYDADNSPLLSSNILTLAIDGESGEVYVATDKGLMSIRGEATAATNKHDDKLIAFPNPVREDYTGPIAIKGLAENAEVKITDNNGVLIYETTALGGQAIWDGYDYNGRRAKTGVYLIFSINEDGSDSKVGKLLIIK